MHLWALADAYSGRYFYCHGRLIRQVTPVVHSYWQLGRLDTAHPALQGSPSCVALGAPLQVELTMSHPSRNLLAGSCCQVPVTESMCLCCPAAVDDG